MNMIQNAKDQVLQLTLNATSCAQALTQPINVTAKGFYLANLRQMKINKRAVLNPLLILSLKTSKKG